MAYGLKINKNKPIHKVNRYEFGQWHLTFKNINKKYKETLYKFSDSLCQFLKPYIIMAFLGFLCQFLSPYPKISFSLHWLLQPYIQKTLSKFSASKFWKAGPKKKLAQVCTTAEQIVGTLSGAALDNYTGCVGCNCPPKGQAHRIK